MRQRLVQHISGQGEKWAVVDSTQNGWKVRIPEGLAMGSESWFPKSEYVLCDPLEEWEDVTGQCEVGRYGGEAPSLNGHLYACDRSNNSINAFFDRDYRLRKVQVWTEDANYSDMLRKSKQWAFIIERKKP